MNSSLEILEARIAPAKILNPMTVVYTDKDGDLVTLKLSKGLFESDAIANAVLKFDTGAGAVNGSTTTPEQLQLIDLQTRPAATVSPMSVRSRPTSISAPSRSRAISASFSPVITTR